MCSRYFLSVMHYTDNLEMTDVCNSGFMSCETDDCNMAQSSIANKTKGDAGSKLFSRSNARPNDLSPCYGLGGVGAQQQQSRRFLIFLRHFRLILIPQEGNDCEGRQKGGLGAELGAGTRLADEQSPPQN